MYEVISRQAYEQTESNKMSREENKTKKLLKKLAVGVVSLVIVIGMMIPTMASNTGDTYITEFYVPVSNVFTVFHSPRAKQDSTPLYVELTSTVHGNVKAQARGMSYTDWMQGQTPSTLNTSNVTANSQGYGVTYVTLTPDIDYSVRSFVYEYGYAFATLGFKAYYDNQSEYIDGVWSPDSAYQHNYAN